MKRVLVIRIWGTLMLMILLNVLCLPTANADFGWEQVVGGVAAGGDGFGDAANYDARSMAVFDGYLYVGTYHTSGGCEVWRSNNGTTWDQVNSNGFGSGNSDISSMAVFGDYLYVGTNNILYACEVRRSNNGSSWIKVNNSGFDDTSNFRASSMVVFGSYLYVGTYNPSDGCEVWRSNDGINWDQVVGDENGLVGNGFGDTANHTASSMAVFGSYLYVGTWGCEVWRSSDGTNWSQVVGDERGGGGVVTASVT